MSKKRGVLVWGLLILATILLFVSSLTVWSKRQLLDSDAWANSSSQLLANDDVRGAVAQTLVDRLFEQDDVVAQVRARLPEQAQGAAPVLAATLESAAVRAADRLLQTPRAQTLWQNINKRAHAGVVKVLEGKDLGKNENISTANGNVTLDLRPLITRLATRLGVEDRLKANADPNAGQVVILKSSQLDSAQSAVKLLKALSSLLLIAVFALYALAIYLAHGAAQAAAGRDRGEPRVRRPRDRLHEALPGRGDRRCGGQGGGEQTSGERDLGDRDERDARHRGLSGRLRRTCPARYGRRRPEPACSRSQAMAGTHLQTSSDRDLGDRCRRVPHPACVGTDVRKPAPARRRTPCRHDRRRNRGATAANAPRIP